ncbi:MAG TPA: hypothetical protein DCW31_04130 [Lactobacillus sp.]|nr:hypothetical protein [Lactobacillus sp.]
MIRKRLISEHPVVVSVQVAAMLAFIGGMVDADSFWFHGGVFASLQSGNLVLMGINIARGQWAAVLERLIPLVTFFIFVGVTRIIQQTVSQRFFRRWLVATLGTESLLLVMVTLLPTFLPRLLLTSCLSALAGIQLQSFRQINGLTFNSTMMTGNIRACAAALFGGLWLHDAQLVVQGLKLLSIFLSFCLGAATLVFLGDTFGQWTLMLGVVVLLIIGATLWQSALAYEKG